MRKTALYLLLSPALWAFHAASSSAEEAHVHGLASLAVAYEGSTMEIQFESPAANIVGFEHEAESEKDKKSVQRAQEILKSANTLFTFVGTQCQLKEASVDTSGLIDEHEHHHEESEHEHEHDAHHEDNHSDEHETTHSEIRALYQFQCQNTQSLASITTTLFKQFPMIEQIQAVWVNEKQQGATTLNHSNQILSLK